MAIDQGNYTVGSGGNYANWTAAFADVTALPAGLLGNIVFSQVSDITQVAQATLIALQKSNGYRISLLCNGYQTLFNYAEASSFFNFSRAVYATIASPNFKVLQTGSVNTAFILTSDRSNTDIGLYSGSTIIYGGYFDLNSLTNTAIWINGSLGTFTSGQVHIWNNKIWSGNGGGNYAIRAAMDVASSMDNKIENNFIYGNSNGISTDNGTGSPATIYVNNNAVSSPNICFLYDPGSVAYNNISSDATADDALVQSGNNINQTFANLYKSLDPTSPEFGKPIRGTIAENGGRSPMIPSNNDGIAGNRRPHRLIA